MGIVVYASSARVTLHTSPASSIGHTPSFTPTSSSSQASTPIASLPHRTAQTMEDEDSEQSLDSDQPVKRRAGEKPVHRRKKKKGTESEDEDHSNEDGESEENSTPASEKSSSQIKRRISFTFMEEFQDEVRSPNRSLSAADHLFSIQATKASMSAVAEQQEVKRTEASHFDSSKTLKEKNRMSLKDLMMILSGILSKEERGRKENDPIEVSDSSYDYGLEDEDNRDAEYEEENLRYDIPVHIVETRRLRRQREKEERKRRPIQSIALPPIDLLSYSSESEISGSKNKADRSRKKRNHSSSDKRTRRHLSTTSRRTVSFETVIQEPLEVDEESEESEPSDSCCDSEHGYDELIETHNMNKHTFETTEDAQQYCSTIIQLIDHNWHQELETAFENHLRQVLRAADYQRFGEERRARFTASLVEPSREIILDTETYLRDQALQSKERRRFSSIIRKLVYSPCSEASVERLFSRVRLIVGKQRFSLSLKMIRASLQVCASLQEKFNTAEILGKKAVRDEQMKEEKEEGKA